MPAYLYALERGADGIEIDVRLCGTGELVVFHDALTGLQCDGPSKAVVDMPFDDVQRLTYSLDSTKQLHPPLLKDVLELCRSRQCKLLLEVKHYHWHSSDLVVGGLRKIVRDYPDVILEATTVISFNPFVLYAIRAALPEVAVGPLYDDSTVSGIALGSCDVVASPWLRVTFPKMVDLVVGRVTEHLLCGLLGASMLCTRLDLTTAAQARRQLRSRRCLYLYGLAQVFPSALTGLPVCVSCDDDHDRLKA
eukprot:CAMPEP_0174873700 /NCGR_PEP_ID=MMETSP1114-20130205/75341_1 /TAXON_ID=312471 /ORGANISM="Neobodo designis, Strain CCAP 1951/1" /LENGTH=249 /DNA_ID=CAMNT_0016109023 /DNA_START=187 /DNA_END=932 /DNA_ORIENTATION=+